MRVRGAGGLLVGIAVYPLAWTLDAFNRQGRGLDLEAATRDLLWYPDGMSPPGHTVAFILLRDALLIGSIVAGVLGLAGVRASRFLVAIGAAGIALGSLPSIVWDPYDFDSSRPPDWVFEDQLWYLSGRWSAVLWFAISVAAMVMALTDSTAKPAMFGAPMPPDGPPPQPQPSHWTQPAPTTPSPTAPPPPAPSPTAPPPPGASTAESPTSPIFPKRD